MLTSNIGALDISDGVPGVLFLMNALGPLDSLGSKIIVDARIATWVAI
jgi:hypothetical protein